LHLTRISRKKLVDLTLPACLTALVLALSGCVSGNSPAGDIEGDVVVVERSKAQPPAWASFTPGRIDEGPAEYRIVTLRSKLLSLPLGLKQTQLAAVESARAELAKLVQDRLVEYGSDHGLPQPANKAELTRLITAATGEVAEHEARVSDIYFETLENRSLPSGDPMAHTYAAYVLVTFPKARLPLIYDAAARRLQRASDPSLRRLAQGATALARSGG
jgi:hypothetical protein